MKTIIIFLALFSLAIAMTAQNHIVLKNDKTIKDARFYEINGDILVYEKDGSLHDIPADDVSKLVIDGRTFIINEKYEVLQYTKDYKSTHINKECANNKNDQGDCRNPLIIYISPLSLLETDPNFKLSGELNLGKKGSFILSGGKCVRNPVSLSTAFNNSSLDRGYLFSAGVKYFINYRKKQMEGLYFSAEVSHKKVFYDNDVLLANPDSFYFYGCNITDSKSVWGSSILMGEQIRKGNLVIDLYAGFGARHIVTSGTNITARYDETEQIIREDLPYTYSWYMPHLKAGIRLGVWF